MWEMRRVPQPKVKKWVVFSLIFVGKKHKIIIIQEEISGREIVEVEFLGEKIKEAKTEMMNLRREFLERYLDN